MILRAAPTRSKLSQAFVTTSFFVVVSGLVLLLAQRVVDPLFSVGIVAIGASMFAAAILLYGLVWVRTTRQKFQDEAIEAFCCGDKTVVMLEHSIGEQVDGNDLFKLLSMETGASTVSGALQNIFDNAAEFEQELRAQFRKHGRGELRQADRDGVMWEVAVLGAEEGPIFWSARPVDQEPLPASSTLLGDSTLAVTIRPDGTIVRTNAAGEIYGLRPKGQLSECLVGTFQHGAVCQFEGNSQKFRGYFANQSEDFVELVFFPVADDELSEATPDQFIHALPVALARICASGQILHINASAKKLIGDKAVVGTNLNEHLEGLGRSIDERMRDIMQGRFHSRTEVARGHVNGHEIFLQVTFDRVNLDGEPSILAIMNDATELKTLEAQFVQSQKMQAVGQLAGGVAHDFNNLLTAINGHCDLILMRHEPSNPDYGDLIQIRHNANRAASLVSQLLAFSRKQTLLPKVIDLYDTLSDLNHLLNRLLGEKVNLRMEHGDDLPQVRVDERQLEQVIMNLVVNARDAMPNGGEVVIKTKRTVFETDCTMDRVVVPFGTYVQIDVTDTGVGIPPDKISKIFEPFFTTKGVGEGTGLGLSTAYGIIKQTGGFIFAKSEVGSGTTFTLYLPTHGGAALEAHSDIPEKVEPTDLTGRGNVLLVEDEIPVRSFAARALNIRGYSVVEAGSAEEALEILEDENKHFDVFVSDVIMPGMDGPTWVRMAQEKRPGVKVVFVSGYAEDAFGDGKISVPNATFLQKPFSLNDLTHTVKEQLEAPLV